MFGNFRIKELSVQLQPRERLVEHGAQALSDAELLAIVISTGDKKTSAYNAAVNLLNTYGTLKRVFSQDINEFKRFSSIGKVKSITFKAIEEISKRIMEKEEAKRSISSPKDVFYTMRKYTFGKKEENLYLISLDGKNKILGIDLISKGTINETIVSAREVYKTAFQNNAANIVLVHNHPSNDPTPSKEDIEVTQNLATVGIKLGVALLDHLIVSDDNFVSLKALNLFNTYCLSKGGDK